MESDPHFIICFKENVGKQHENVLSKATFYTRKSIENKKNQNL